MHSSFCKIVLTHSSRTSSNAIFDMQSFPIPLFLSLRLTQSGFNLWFIWHIWIPFLWYYNPCLEVKESTSCLIPSFFLPLCCPPLHHGVACHQGKACLSHLCKTYSTQHGIFNYHLSDTKGSYYKQMSGPRRHKRGKSRHLKTD